LERLKDYSMQPILDLLTVINVKQNYQRKAYQKKP